MNKIDVTIPGEPIPQPRVTTAITRVGNKVMRRTFMPKSARKDGTGSIRAWRELVAIKLREVLPYPPPKWDGPVELDVTFWFDRTQELQKPKHSAGEIPHDVKPDLDNLIKAIKDTMTDEGVWYDDGRVCDTVIRKRYVARGCGPGCRIIARLITPDTESLYA